MLKRLLAGATTLLLALGMVALTTAPASANDNKVSICHYDQSGKWESISVAKAALSGSGHIDPSASDDHANDIVPPFDAYLGKNYNATSDNVPGYPAVAPFSGFTGAQILANDCKLPSSLAVTGQGIPESCDDGEVVPGSILLTVLVNGTPVSLPATGVTVTVTGPGLAGVAVTSTTLSGLEEGLYTFTVSVDGSKYLSTPSPFTVSVGGSGECDDVEEIPVAVTATPVGETCDDGDVVGGSITLTVLVDGVPVTVPASDISITVQGPGFAVPTTVTSGTLSGLADGVYTFAVTVEGGYVLTTPASFDATVTDSGDCTVVEDLEVSVTGEPLPETCDVPTGTIVPGSATLVVTVDGAPVTLPAAGVTVTVEGPGYPAGTPVTSNELTGLSDGDYVFTVTVGSGRVLTSTSPFTLTVGDFDFFECFQQVDHPLVEPSVVYVEPTCEADGSFTLSNSETAPDAVVPAVFWTVDTASVAEATYPAAAGRVVHIVATANGPTYGFAGSSPTIDFDHTFATPVGCDLTTLAITGEDSSPMLWTALLLGLLGAALVRSAARTAHRTTS